LKVINEYTYFLATGSDRVTTWNEVQSSGHHVFKCFISYITVKFLTLWNSYWIWKYRVYHILFVQGGCGRSGCNLLLLWTGSSWWYCTSAMNHLVCLHLLMHFSVNHSVLYNMAWVRYTIEQHVCLVQLCFSYMFARKFQFKFLGEQVPRWQYIHYLVNKLKTTGSSLDKKPGRKWIVLTEETLDDIGARLETSPRKSLKWLAQETGVLMTSSWRATKLLKLWPYNTTVIHALKEHDLVARISFCDWFLADSYLK
jgi:hypothetical protein